MSGVTARLGFRFQDWFLLREALRHLHQVLTISWQQGSRDPRSDIRRCPIQFALEARVTISDAAPEWDSLVIEDGRIKVIEIKSGQMSADDRRALWRRIRKETAASVEKMAQVDPVLVIDPSRAGNYDAFRKLAEFASQIPGPPPLPVAPPPSVSDAAIPAAFCPTAECRKSPPGTAQDAKRLIQKRVLLGRIARVELAGEFAPEGFGVAEHLVRA